MNRQIEDAKEKFGKLLEEQLNRAERIKGGVYANYGNMEKIVIGVCGGDGIGPAITAQAEKCLRKLFEDEMGRGKICIKSVEGLTIENRLKEGRAIPEKVLEELKSCDVILKGPTTTPQADWNTANIESANVAMRRELDLFANVRPVKVVEEGIDWTFFRENTEGAYAVGSKGFNVSDDLAVDFTFTTTEGTERICRAAFEFARNNGKTRVSCVTKANVIKTTDGKFLNICKKVAEEYKGIEMDDWYIDIMTAKLIDKNRRKNFQVFVLPNLYGDILTDEAAEFQGGVGTAGSANIGKKYAMFEAIHGSAPRMVEEGRAKFADPSSVMRAAAMLAAHIGFGEKARKLENALDFCKNEGKVFMTGRENGATNVEFTEYVIESLSKW